MTDIVKRLRNITASDSRWCDPDCVRFAKAASMAMDAAADEIERLRQWKAEALVVIGGWERTWMAAGGPGELGQSKSEGVLAEIERLRAEAAVMTEKLAQAWRERDLYRSRVSAQDRMLDSLHSRLQHALDGTVGEA